MLFADGHATSVAPPPSKAPLAWVVIAPLDGSNFLVVGQECRPVAEKLDQDCADDELPLRAFMLTGTTWVALPDPPKSTGLQAFEIPGNKTHGRFLTVLGTMVTYDTDAKQWSEEPTGVSRIFGVCSTTAGIMIVGERESAPVTAPKGR